MRGRELRMTDCGLRIADLEQKETKVTKKSESSFVACVISRVDPVLAASGIGD
jgi:hypothetical protein